MNEEKKHKKNHKKENNNSTNIQSASSALPKIEIISQKTYEPTRISPEEREKIHQEHGCAPMMLIFNNKSCEKLKKHIEWAQHTRRNTVEQGGILLGKVFRYKNEIFSFVEDSVIADTKGTSAFVEFSPEMWADMQKRTDEINAHRNEDDQLFIIGWFHTHPNGLEVFMSGTDRNTQNKNYSQDWQAALVLNPHRMKLRVFFGKELQEGKIIGWKFNTPPDILHKSQHTKKEEVLSPQADVDTFSYSKNSELDWYKLKIAEYREQNSYLKKKVKAYFSALFATILLLILVIFSFFVHDKSTIIKEKDTLSSASHTQAAEPESKSTVFFQITYEEWTSSDLDYFCKVKIQEINKSSTDKTKPAYVQKIRCNSNEDAFVNLKKGTYRISFKELPALPDGAKFRTPTTKTITVDGKNPQLLSYKLELSDEVVTSESATADVSTSLTDNHNQETPVTTTAPVEAAITENTSEETRQTVTEASTASVTEPTGVKADQ